MSHRMKKLVLVLSLVLPASSLFAQQGTVGISDGFSFVAPLKVGVGQDNHFLVDRTPPADRLFVLSLPPSVQSLAPDFRPKRLDDQVMTLTLPKIAFQNYSRRHELVMTYVPEIEMFHTNTDQNSWGHDAAVSFRYHVSRNIQVSVGDSYVTSKDPSRTLQNVFLLLPRSRYEQNAIRGEVELQTSGVTGFQVRYDTTRSTFGQTGEIDPFQLRILDTSAGGLTFTMTHLLSRTQRLRARVSFYRFNPINQAGAVITSQDEPINRAVELQYRIHPNPGTNVMFSGGASAVANRLTYMLGVTSDRRIGSLWFGGGFTRSLAFTALGPTFFANGVNPAGFYDALFLTARAELTRKSTIQMRATGARAAASSLVQASQSLIGLARFDYRLNDRTVWFTSFQTFQQNKNEYVRSALSRNQFTVGIEFSLSSDRDRRTNRLNEDEQYVALTDHTRHRDTSQ
jgi:hypothetical protein